MLMPYLSRFFKEKIEHLSLLCHQVVALGGFFYAKIYSKGGITDVVRQGD